jgi:hypothetical protein
MVDVSAILNSIKPRIRDLHQETRIRELYDRLRAAYQKDGAPGMTGELEGDWRSLRTKFNMSLEKVKKETGLY